jgi:hypothetical protein
MYYFPLAINIDSLFLQINVSIFTLTNISIIMYIWIAFIFQARNVMLFNSLFEKPILLLLLFLLQFEISLSLKSPYIKDLVFLVAWSEEGVTLQR